MKGAALKLPQPDSQEERPTGQINAKFRERIPAIIEEISSSMMDIKPALEKAKISFSEFLDYLDFEITKTKLDIEKREWSSRSDQEELRKRRSWLRHIKALRADFEAEDVDCSWKIMQSLIDRAGNTF